MAHLWEPLKVIHSPLAVRLALESLRLFTVLLLKLCGFQRGRVDIAEGARGGRGSRYEFWVLPPAAAAAAFEEEEEEKEETAAADTVPAVASRLLRSGGGRFRLGRRRGQRSMRSQSLALADSASSLKGEPIVHLEGGCEGEGGGGDSGEAPPPLPLLRRRRRLAATTAAAASGGDDDDDEDDPASSSDDPSAAPILFLHGVGLGITPYLLLIAALRKRFPRRPLLLLEARHVSVGLVPTRAASTCDVARAAIAAMERNGWRSAAVVAHSYGTFVAARMLDARPEAVQSLVLLDPVCALTIYPQLLANFVYKPPVALLSKKEKQCAEGRSSSGYFWSKQGEEEGAEEGDEEEEETIAASTSPAPAPFAAAASAAATARALLTAADSARFLFSRDLTVGEAFCRRFAWHRECLWPQDLRHAGKSTLFGLARGDDLVPSALVMSALAAAGSRASVSGNDDPRAGHGGFLMDREWQRRLLDGAEMVIDAGAEEERAEKETRRGRRRGRMMSEGEEEEGEEVEAAASKGKAAATAAAAAFAAAAALLDAAAAPDSPPARPVTADIGERKRRRKTRSFSSRPKVVPVVLEAL